MLNPSLPLTTGSVRHLAKQKAARAWRESGDYQEIVPLRKAASTGTLFIIEGFSIPEAGSE